MTLHGFLIMPPTITMFRNFASLGHFRIDAPVYTECGRASAAADVASTII